MLALHPCLVVIQVIIFFSLGFFVCDLTRGLVVIYKHSTLPWVIFQK